MPHGRIPKEITNSMLYDKRKRGRSKERWLNQIENDLYRVILHQCKTLASDRTQWKKIIKETKVHIRRSVTRRRRMYYTISELIKLSNLLGI